jgi:peptide chain release factor 1
MEFNDALVSKLRERSDRFAELTDLIASPEVLGDAKRYPALLRERGSLESSAKMFEAVEALRRQRAEAVVIIDEGGDEDLVALAQEDLDGLEEQEQALDDQIKLALIADPEQNRTKVIFEIRAGTGGDEATLFAADLFRMYSKFFENHRLKVDLISESRTEVGGFKEIIFGVKGPGAWKLLRFESGGHRVQRVPSTETQGRIHTSAATCAVLPEAEEVEIDIKDEELRIDTMRSSGPGGQSVNKTSSAVRITHLPTEVVVICQDEKSQHKNKAKAMRILRARLFELKKNEIDEERSAERKDQIGSGDRSARVRTYNFPQNRLTDHRLEDTERKNFSLEQVIQGRLEPVIEALEAKDREDRLSNL